MANLNNLESPSKLSTTNTQIIGAGYTLPSGFNDLRQPDELSVLYAQNSDAIYNKYKLETNNSGLLRFGPKQPFITVNPNNARKGVNGLKRYESRALPIGSALQDVARISKFSVSGNGIIFLGKQLILQGLNSFNETKLYNPLMPILASTSIASFGLITPPTRHIEPNLGGVLGALGLGAVSNALGLNKPTPPKGTVGAGALPINAGDGGKGLIRGSTASQANKNFQSKWGGGKSAGFLSGVGNFFKSNTLFGAFIPVGQPNGEKYKVGEKTYNTMLANESVWITGKQDGDQYVGISQRWWGSTDGTSKSTPSTFLRFAPFVSVADSKGNAGINFLVKGKINNKSFGIPWDSATDPKGSKYGNYVGFTRLLKGGEDGLDLTSLEFSDQIVNYAYYTGTVKRNLTSPVYFDWGTKHSDKTDPVVEDLINNNLKKLIENLKKEDINAKNEKYTLNPDPVSGYAYTPIRQYNWESSAIGYDYIDKTVKSDKYFSATRFKNLKTLDPVPNANGENKNIGLSGPQRSDKINVLKVLSEELFKEKYSEDSDLIKFYFHDLVNNKYIPFRATVTGLNENLNADWTAIEYIGRADKLQSYKGFSRTLSFKFNVVANSIKELLPMWQRINYLVGLTKPANYTSGDQNNPSNIYSRFIIPPLVKITIGDMYKNQPGVIKSVGMNIPDNCVWETLSEEYAEKNDWSYLNGVIQWNDSKGKYAQFPRECELILSMDLLEKETPIVGGSNFGDFYKTPIPDNRDDGSISTAIRGTRNSFSEELYLNDQYIKK